MKARSIGRQRRTEEYPITAARLRGSKLAIYSELEREREGEGDTCAAVRWSTPIMAPFGSSICIEWNGVGEEARSTR